VGFTARYCYAALRTFIEMPAIAEAPLPIAKVLGEGGAEFQPPQRGKADYTFRRNAFPDGTIVPIVGVAK
jgi:hypothetical protein